MWLPHYLRSPALDGSATPFLCDSADFGGVSDYLTKATAFTGSADSKTVILSAWFRVDGGAGVDMRIFSTTAGTTVTKFLLIRDAAGTATIYGSTSAGTIVLQYTTAATFATGATWYHVLAAVDLANSANRAVYVNDSADAGTWTTYTNSNINFAADHSSVAARFDGLTPFNGCLAEMYFAPGQWLDLSSSTNRRKFISATGKAVSLGTDGSTPTGVAPYMYLHLDSGEAVANFATNRAGAGNFTVVGSLATGSTSPTT